MDGGNRTAESVGDELGAKASELMESRTPREQFESSVADDPRGWQRLKEVVKNPGDLDRQKQAGFYVEGEAFPRRVPQEVMRTEYETVRSQLGQMILDLEPIVLAEYDPRGRRIVRSAQLRLSREWVKRGRRVPEYVCRHRGTR